MVSDRASQSQNGRFFRRQEINDPHAGISDKKNPKTRIKPTGLSSPALELIIKKTFALAIVRRSHHAANSDLENPINDLGIRMTRLKHFAYFMSLDPSLPSG